MSTKVLFPALTTALIVDIFGDSEFIIGKQRLTRPGICISMEKQLPPYNTFNNYLKNHFGERVYRVPVDAGFTCPNRDGVRAFGGCTFCDDRGSGAPTINIELSVREQLNSGIKRVGRRFKAKKFMAYFQAFSNTYAPVGVLRSLYDIAFEFPEIDGLCIGTRPDCLDDDVLDLLAEYNEKTFVWLEIGLQSAKNKTLDLINRGHSAEEFFDAVRRTKSRGLRVATHLIFGLPQETREDMMETVRQISDPTLELDAVKIHQLCIYRGTPMEMDYKAGVLPVLDEDVYVEMVADALEILPPNMVIMRLVAEGMEEEIIAPSWSFEKERVTKRIDDLMRARGTVQGSKFQYKETALIK